MGGKSKIIIRNKSGDEIGVVYISTESTAYKRYVEGLEQYKNILIPLMCVNITADGALQINPQIYGTAHRTGAYSGIFEFTVSVEPRT